MHLKMAVNLSRIYQEQNRILEILNEQDRSRLGQELITCAVQEQNRKGFFENLKA